MNKFHHLYLLAGFGIISQAAPAEEPATIDETDKDTPVIIIEGKKIEQVNIREVKSADLAEALNKQLPSLSIVRRSGISNDIILRGQKKDNINVLIDNAKIYGACPNRMDPPTSHVATNNISSIEVTEGPYDVENFGTLSGAVKITTKMPETGFHGDINLGLGSWDYQKLSATLSGGSEKVRALLSFSNESGGQYEDGNGNDFPAQIEAFSPGSMANYKPQYEDLDAYEKSTVMGKVYAYVAENQELEFGYTANRSDDILYPSSPMDALRDDSDIYTLDYRIFNLGKYSDKLELQLYNSTVEHPMSTYYRLSSGTDSANERISYLETDTSGSKLINHLSLNDSTDMKIGVDFSTRNWDGEYEGFGTSAGITGIASIPNVDTDNQALFVEMNKQLQTMKLRFGARADDTEITPGDNSLDSNDYSAFSAFAFATYPLNERHSLFGGIGRASRVPDARELYFHSAMGGGMLIGNPDLDQTTNNEIDFGLDTRYGQSHVKTRLFYSSLDNFIHYNASKTMRRFDNVDATIYGIDISGSYVSSPRTSIDYGLAWQHGSKNEALDGQTDRDLAEIPPLKARMAFNYKYRENNDAQVEFVAADSWNNYDADNGEQKLDSWGVINVKVNHHFSRQLGLTVGIDNLFDETYAVSNTYNDLTLLSDGTGDVMLINEPGRYLYMNAVYSF